MEFLKVPSSVLCYSYFILMTYQTVFSLQPPAFMKMTLNYLHLHMTRPNPSKFMFNGSAYNIINKGNHSSKHIYMGNTVISRVSSQKCLRVYIDQKLSWEEHTEKICKNASAGIGAIRRLKPIAPTTSLITIYKARVQPYFDYCSPLWDNCGKVQRDKIQKLQSRAARVITGANYEMNYDRYFESIKTSNPRFKAV